jgi:hypothetical protein
MSNVTNEEIEIRVQINYLMGKIDGLQSLIGNISEDADEVINRLIDMVEKNIVELESKLENINEDKS